ncbi:hypothetical protein LJ707_13340 [Mucilaginibacter sp. UR6-1]|uniref:hypothetical protein n=1 Tax=Mucilaginibacter sp. UR6-1 TaxID=1435643 RepID=UPI001E37C172|nr:hypothetical protein [Mucilaginibacter sp. UR6-1]MCC8409916.1 hypothetical protein [Mucilaginibacter sp. UR6-1]
MENKKLEKLIGSVDKLLKFFTEKKEVFEAVKVKDSDVSIESAMEVGADVSISTSNGSEPATDGVYSLENDKVITVKDGKIESIQGGEETKPADEELADEAGAEPIAEDEKPKEDEAVKALEDRVKSLEETIKTLMDSINAVPSKQDVSEFKNQLLTVNDSIIALSKIPTQKSVDARPEMKDSEEDKIKRVASLFYKQ